MMRLGVLISGSGTNLQAIIDAIAAGTLDAELALVVSSRPDAAGLARAATTGIPTVALSREVYRESWAADELIAEQLARSGVELVVMAGYMRQIGPELLDAFPDRIVNLHPALLPAFRGAHAIDDAWAAGVKLSGVSVHFADASYDTGPIIAQQAVPILEGDSLEDFEARIHAAEHELLPQVLQLFAEGRVRIDAERKVRIS